MFCSSLVDVLSDSARPIPIITDTMNDEYHILYRFVWWRWKRIGKK